MLNSLLSMALLNIYVMYLSMAIIQLTFSLLLFILIPQALETNAFKLYEVTAFNDHERHVLYTIQTSNESVMFLHGVTNEAAMPMKVIVDACCTQIFEDKLHYEGIEYIILDDLSKTLYRNPINSFGAAKGFWKWEHLSSWIERRQKMYPLLEKISISSTYEKRELFILSIEKRKENPAVVIVGGEKGRDWMSPAVIFNIITQFLMKTNSFSILDYYTFYFLPIFNPDGYVYSMAADRFWEKNRKVFFPKKKCIRENGSVDIAVGVNVERNWYFGKSLAGFSSECSSVYLGHHPLSEEEPKGLEDFLNKNAIDLLAYINLKGFGGRFITLPYSDNTMHSNNHGVVMEIIMSACEKVYQSYNTTYHYGTTARFFYNISGNSADWIKKQFNIPIVSTIHMKYMDEILPSESHIEPLTEEVVTILKEVLMISKEIYGPLFNYQQELIANTQTFALVTVVFIIYTLILQ